MGGYTQECIIILEEQLESTDMTGSYLLPILNEIIATDGANEQELLCEKLLIEAKIFNRVKT